ncbi:MAG: N-acylneuraminate-9-phosphate synthase [Candidatus Hydrogenedentota bacterium]|nr:MAG: N-acylneuraminate-9-phosphate synthase [Candidatus Hydrogenedentota bacterium]
MGCPAWVIAEIGGNFLDVETGCRLVDLAIDCGCDAVKLQTYRAETIASRKAMYDMPNVGKASQFDLFKKYELSFEVHQAIWEYCRERGIFIFSTPSHRDDVELLERLGCAAYKIGSDDAVNLPFLREVAARGKPVLLSTGMCTLEEVRESVSTILAVNSELALLHCVTNYPCAIEDVNLMCIRRMQEEFGIPVGFSDHTLGTIASEAAVAAGAHIIEKHFTYDKNADGPDHMLSLDPTEMKEMVRNIRLIEAALGDGVKRPALGEKTTRINNRKSLVSTRTIEAGEILSEDNVAIKRPGTGIPPKYIDQVLGRSARRRIEAEEPICWEDV